MRWSPRIPFPSPPLNQALAVVLRKHKKRQESVGPGETSIHHLYAVVLGEVEIQTNNTWHTALPRTVAYFRPGLRYAIKHKRHYKGPITIIVIQFCPPKNWKPPALNDPLRLPEHWWRRLLELDSACSFDRYGRRVVPAHQILQLLTNISNAVPATKVGGSANLPHADTLASWMETWARAEEIIRLKAGSGLSIDELARTVHVSPVQLRRIYMAAAGISPKQSLTNWRIGEGKRLLKEGQLSITKISQSLGFGSSQRFCTAFKAETGTTPRTFAKNC